MADGALGNIRVGGADPEYVGGVLLVRDADVHVFAEFAHHLSRFFAAPQLVPII